MNEGDCSWAECVLSKYKAVDLTHSAHKEGKERKRERRERRGKEEMREEKECCHY